jgi:hypothetical protein
MERKLVIVSRIDYRAISSTLRIRIITDGRTVAPFSRALKYVACFEPFSTFDL